MHPQALNYHHGIAIVTVESMAVHSPRPLVRGSSPGPPALAPSAPKSRLRMVACPGASTAATPAAAAAATSGATEGPTATVAASSAAAEGGHACWGLVPAARRPRLPGAGGLRL